MLNQKIADFLTYLSSAHTSQKYLHHCYKNSQIDDAEKKSYQNSYRFLYYLEHGHNFFKTGNQADLVVQPILYFYGMVHLLKACLLTRRPDYPENTSMLAHGVSTRKRKKQQYAFLQDEVKIQHKGLFPYFSLYLFNINQFTVDKVDMNQLFATIPELNELFSHHRGEGTMVKVGNLNDHQLRLPMSLLDTYHMTKSNFISHMSNYLNCIENDQVDNDSIVLQLKKPLTLSSNGPFYYHANRQQFFLPKKRHYLTIHHEVMNHYLLLYNLSMICRYETEWWGELVHMLPTEDYPFIKQFMSITSTKIPLLLGYFLLEQKHRAPYSP